MHLSIRREKCSTLSSLPPGGLPYTVSASLRYLVHKSTAEHNILMQTPASGEDSCGSNLVFCDKALQTMAHSVLPKQGF